MATAADMYCDQDLAGPLQNALSLGLQSPEVADKAMDALEQLEESNFQALTSIAPLVSAAHPVTQHAASASLAS